MSMSIVTGDLAWRLKDISMFLVSAVIYSCNVYGINKTIHYMQISIVTLNVCSRSFKVKMKKSKLNKKNIKQRVGLYIWKAYRFYGQCFVPFYAYDYMTQSIARFLCDSWTFVARN